MLQGQVSLLCSLLHDLSSCTYCDNDLNSIQQHFFKPFTDLFQCSIGIIPLYLRPYDYKILNKFDALILLFAGLATLIPLADTVSQQLSTATIIIVMVLPLIFFIALELIVHKETIKTTATKMTTNFTAKSDLTTNNNNDILMGDIGLVIDDNVRENAIICEM